MKKKITVLALCITLVLGLAGCCFSHDWVAADCVTPKTCSKCEKTEGAPLGHIWQDATCTTRQTCSVCAEEMGELAEHTWQDATCTVPKTCSVCAATEGELDSHTWQDATCTAPKTCSVCSATEGEPLSHLYVWSVTEEPALGKEGTKEGTCSLCSDVVTESIEPLVATYEWGKTTTLDVPPATVKVTVNKADSAYGIEFVCESMNTMEFSGFMYGSKVDWGIDRVKIYDQLMRIFRNNNKESLEENIDCYTLNLNGQTWKAYMNMDESAGTFVRLLVDSLDAFNEVTGLSLTE